MFSMIIIFLLQLFIVPGNTTNTAPFRRLPEESKPREYCDEIVANDGMFFYRPYNQLYKKTFVITEKQKHIPSETGSPPPTIRKPSGSNKSLYVLIFITVLITATSSGVLNFYSYSINNTYHLRLT